jgi:hypothetical protein
MKSFLENLLHRSSPQYLDAGDGKGADIVPACLSVYLFARALDSGEREAKESKSTLGAPAIVTASVSSAAQRSEIIDTWVTKILAWGADTHIFRVVPATGQGGVTEARPSVRRFLLSGVPGSQGVEHHGVNALGG